MKIYYSRSNDVDDSKVRPLIMTFISNLPNYSKDWIELSEHRRGSTYNPELIRNADIVIVGIDEFHTSAPKIGKGCYDEILMAFKFNIPVFVINNDSSVNRFMIQNIKEKDLRIEVETNWRKGYAYISIHKTLTGINISPYSVYGSYIDDKEGIELMSKKFYQKLFDEVIFPLGCQTLAKVNLSYEPISDCSDDELLL